MTRRLKLLLKAKNNPRGLRFGEFTALIEALGFVFDRQKGSHRLYVHHGIRQVVNIQPRSDGKAKIAQVVEFLDLVDRYDLRFEEER